MRRRQELSNNNMKSHRKTRDGSAGKLAQIIRSQAHQHQVEPPQLDSVIIRNLTYEVGRGKGRKLILNRINLTVAEGTIYGLLGPSGCGKTTMLRCVAGRIRPRNGSVLVFGFQPGHGQSQVPGRDIGYMPQEISIYEDFTIEESLRFFGKINRMASDQIEQRIEFLLQFLDLPSRQRLVTNLSGGQKRRVSLAAALVHSPPLLILDEPTVGVDPLLRQSIWQHLVTLTNTERISVIITTHYIEEARQAHVVGLMRHGKILAESSPDDLMRKHGLSNLEDVFLRLCVSDSSSTDEHPPGEQVPNNKTKSTTNFASAHNDMRHLESGLFARPTIAGPLKALGPASDGRKSINNGLVSPSQRATVLIHTGTNNIEYVAGVEVGSYTNEAVEIMSSEEEEEEVVELASVEMNVTQIKFHGGGLREELGQPKQVEPVEEYLLLQEALWASRRNSELNYMSLKLNRGYGTSRRSMVSFKRPESSRQSPLAEWWATLMAVTWKNYVRLRRNPPVLVFQFMLPAIQVILFCLCIGGEPFDVPVAIVNDETEPRSSTQFLNGLNNKVIRQIKYDNLTSALEAVKKGRVWGALHIPEKYSQNLQTRLIMGEDVNNETISNGTIRVYPDLTNLHLAMALETTFREAFLKFAKDSLEELGYDRSLADLPIQIARPIYGNMKKDSYLEFMAPGVVISISYVMATGLTALAFILERRDGLLERSLVSGVQTNQILLAHAINQVFVMMIQIFLVLGCTFFVFEIPSRGPFFWVVLLILLQGCVGMSFGLLVSAICKEENTAVMMVVGTFYTNLILAGIIWPIEAMPHWLRPVSYAQPQTLPTETLRHILSRGWGITESGVLLGFGVTIGWLIVFLTASGLIFKYSR